MKSTTNPRKVQQDALHREWSEVHALIDEAAAGVKRQRAAQPNAVDQFVAEDRALRQRERAEAAHLAELAQRASLMPGQLLPGEAERDAAEAERFAREERAREEREREREESYLASLVTEAQRIAEAVTDDTGGI